MKKSAPSSLNLLITTLLLIFVAFIAYKLGVSTQHKFADSNLETQVPKNNSKLLSKTYLISISKDKNSVRYYNGNGFSFTYPSKFALNTDESWPYAVALLMQSGSTAYDLSVEVATSKEDLYRLVTRQIDIQNGYGVMKQKGSMYVVFGNPNKDPEVTKIIDTFKFE